jgi:hypothetical protein
VPREDSLAKIAKPAKKNQRFNLPLVLLFRVFHIASSASAIFAISARVIATVGLKPDLQRL